MLKVTSAGRVTRLNCTLRGHNDAISGLQVFYVPSSLAARSEEHEIQLLSPTLVSSDESGWIYWWDLTSRRPLGVWKAHDGNVLTIKQLGLTWDRGAPVFDDAWFGKLLSHGKDGELKIWDIFEFSQDATHTFKPASVLSRRIYTEGGRAAQWPTPPVAFQMPINVMNFSNVDIRNGILLAPGTQDSAKLDIYRIDAEDKALKRLCKAVDPLEIAEKNDMDLNVQVPPENSSRGLGIVMKLVWLGDEKFAVGFESGHVVTFALKDDEVDILDFDSQHYPNPILALHYDHYNDKLISTSSADKIVIHSQDEHRTFKLKHKGVADVKTMENMVGMVTWDGYSRFYSYDNDSILKFQFKLHKVVPSIAATNSTVDIAENVGDLQQRASVLAFSHNQAFSRSTLVHTNGMGKNIVRRRDEMNLVSKFLFIGYKDGRIAIYTINE
ncbi:hypothetical protein KL933_002004 [Ogataea haglerorum]|uniref:ASTRA-associated protein 1 n=1 Tax=Ogataea haglerorum TaxID=1937702 RepID=A0AAN6I1B0_9ASCO|nr:hypothetical protein KL933_002004 [Ogataea haglerorum]